MPRETEDVRKEREDSFQLLFTANPIPMWVYDLESLRFLEVNSAAVEWFGYRREELLAMTILDIRPADDVPSLRENAVPPRPELSGSDVWRHTRKNGEVREVEVVSHRLRFQGREASLVVAQHMPEPRQAEVNPRMTESRFRSLIEHSSDAIALTDANGVILYLTPSSKSIDGYAPESAGGKERGGADPS